MTRVDFMTLENTPDRLIDHLIQLMVDSEILSPTATCEGIEAFRQAAKVQIRMARLRIPTIPPRQETDE